MSRFIFSIIATLLATSLASAQSYSKDIRPFFVKYCLECHNAKAQKGGLSLETFKEAIDGSDGGAVIVPGKPNDSRLVFLIEHKDKPSMPPPKAKFQPTKDEIKLVRAWIADGAKDDAANVKVELPAIKAKVDTLKPVTALAYDRKADLLVIARDNDVTFIKFDPAIQERKLASLNNARITSTVIQRGDEQKMFSILLFATISGKGPHIIPLGASDKFGAIPISHTDDVLDVAIHPGGVSASSGYDSLIVLSAKSGVHRLKEHSDAVYGLAFSPDGKLLASVSADRTMKIFDVEKGKLLYTLGHATDWLYTVAWSPDGKYLVSGGVDKSIRVYDGTRPLTGLGSPNLLQSVFAHEGPVQKVLFTGDSKTLYSVGQDRVIKAWDIEKMVERKVYDKQPETVLCMALREDAGQIIVGRYDGIVQLIDMKTGKVAHEFAQEKPKPRDERSDSRGSNPEKSPLSSADLKQLTGILDRAGAVQIHRLNVKKGQQLGAQITVQGNAKFEPMLTLTDSSGRVFEESADGLLGHTFAEAGSVSISVRDRDFRGGADFKYRLALGEIPIVTAVFPMGMQRGTTGYLHLEGVFLPKEMIPFSVPADAKPGQMMPLPVRDGVLGKAQIVVGEFPDVVKGSIPVPGSANGRIVKDNQNDLWTFRAKKGERLIVEVNARRIGSRLDSIIEILDAKDQPVPRAVLRSQAATNVTFRDHDSAQGNIRIHAWSELGVNDFLFVGNELMKIQALPTHPDADCNFFAADGKRLGRLDTTPTHHANGTPMYKVSLHPPGTVFPSNGFPVFTLFYKNDDGGPGYGRDSRIFFDPPADGEFKIRIADARGMGGVNFGYRLTVRKPRPDFKVRFAPAAPVIHNSGAAMLTISIDRLDGYDGPITVRFENLPPGITAPPTTIEAGTFSTAVALHAEVKTPIMPAKTPMQVIGEAFIDGKRQTQVTTAPAPKVIEPGDIRTWTDESAVALKPGGQAKLVVHIERKPGFTGRVPLDVKGLPHGVRVLDIGLNGILVNENETKRTVVLYAEPWVQAQDHPFVVLAKREGKGTEHAAKSVLLQVRFQGANPDEAMTKLLTERLEAARKAYENALKGMGEFKKYDRGPYGLQLAVPPEDVYFWSVRWLESENDLKPKQADRHAALEAHLKRMKELDAKLKKLDPHALPDWALAEAKWYRLEAERWLAADQRKDANQDTENLKGRAEAAKMAYEKMLNGMTEIKRAYAGPIWGPPPVSQDEVYSWSVRWLKSENDLKPKQADRVAASEAHRKRVAALEAKVKLLAPELMPEWALSEAEWYRLEAELWLAADRPKDADQGEVKAKLLKARVASATKAFEGSFTGVWTVRRPAKDLWIPLAEPKEAYAWSVHWLKSEVDWKPDRADQIAAFEAHLKRTRAMEKKVKVITPQLLPERALTEVRWYRLEAELSLERAKAKK